MKRSALLVLFLVSTGAAAQPIADKPNRQGQEAVEGKVVQKKERMTLQGHERAVYSVAFSSDGTKLASGGQDQTVKVWDVAAGKLLMTLRGHANHVHTLVFSADNRYLASCDGYDSITQISRVWDLATQESLHKASIRIGHGAGLALATDGKTLLVASDEVKKSEEAFLTLWNLAKDKETRRLVQPSTVYSLAASRDGQWAALGHENLARLIDLATGKKKMDIAVDNRPTGLAFTPDNKVLVVGRTFDVQLWDIASQKVKTTFSPGPDSSQVRATALSPNGKLVGAATIDKHAIVAKSTVIYLWNLETGKLLAVCKGHTAEALALSFSPDSRTLVSAGHDRTIRLWDVPQDKD
jgi:WD40 repeat protein